MSEKRVKVIGYAKKEVYNNNVDYRNFSDDMVGNQFTSGGGNALFTLGNFKVTTNLDDRLSRTFNLGAFSKYYSLNKLKLGEDISLLGYKDVKMMKLNLDKADLSNYAYFGSLKEFIRVSLEQIIMKWPASLYVTKVNQINPLSDNPTFENYSYNRFTNKSTFNINVGYIQNHFDINVKKDGTVLNTFNKNNKARDLNLSFPDYVISVNGQEYPILNFIGYSTSSLLTFEVLGDPFTNTGNVNYHIKPKQEKLNSFFMGLDSFGSHLLERNTIPKYKASFNYVFETENGSKILGSKTVTWPVSDGYNIDFQSTEYVAFVKDLLDIADNNDNSKSNIITNRLVSKSILEFDTIDAKMDKTLKIYGRNMDEVKTYIDGIRFVNHISYNKKNNVPDRLVKNLARTMGWELTTSLFNIDFNDDFLSSKGSLNLSPVESEIEFWRRLIMNSPWIWKSKGTRKVVEFLLHFVGTPKGLVTFNEYVYKANNTIDVTELEEIFDSLGMIYDPSASIVDKEGFPRILRSNGNMYFQKGGQWYRQTSGENANIDLNKGNNPHVGPYDFGYEYINQFNNVVPNFEPVVISTTRVSSTNEQIFLNYDSGRFDKFLATGEDINNTINSYIQILTTDNLPVDSTIISVTDQVVKTPKPKAESEDDAYEVGSYKISIVRKDPEYNNPCDYGSFTLDGNGLVLFTHADNSQDYLMTAECCSGLGFTPELNEMSQYVCRWKAVVTDLCANYTLTDKINTDGYAVFINGETGALTDLVPTAECCTKEGLTYANEGDMYHCLEGAVQQPTCEDYVFTGEFYDGVEVYTSFAKFQYGEGITSTVPSAECCSVNGLKATTFNGEVKCIEDVANCESYTIYKIMKDGTVHFKDDNGLIVNEVANTECCAYHGFESTQLDNGNYMCHEAVEVITEPVLNLVTRNGDGYEEIMTMEIIGVPNTTVKYRVTVMVAGDHGFTNSLTNLATGENVTPANPTPFVGSYCEGSITLGDSGRVEVDMTTTARPPLRELSNNCTSLEFSIMDYDYVTINGNNRLLNEACYPI